MTLTNVSSCISTDPTGGGAEWVVNVDARARQRWGLSMRVEAEGPGFAWGRVTHSIGPRRTADVAKGEAIRHGPMSTLRAIPPAVADLLAEAVRGGRDSC